MNIHNLTAIFNQCLHAFYFSKYLSKFSFNVFRQNWWIHLHRFTFLALNFLTITNLGVLFYLDIVRSTLFWTISFIFCSLASSCIILHFYKFIKTATVKSLDSYSSRLSYFPCLVTLIALTLPQKYTSFTLKFEFHWLPYYPCPSFSLIINNTVSFWRWDTLLSR